MEHAFRADLHCHSTFSDGSFTPDNLIKLAKEIGLKGLSITDHDTIHAYDHLEDDLLISGVEFSTVFQHASVHILGYSFALKNQKIIEFCQKHKERREKRCQMILSLLTEKGMPLSMEEVIACTSDMEGVLGRPHIAKAMFLKGYVETQQEAFKLFIGEGKPCYVSGQQYSAEETIDVIHEAGGYAIVAHPHLLKDSQLIHDLLSLNFDGLEGYYAQMNLEQNGRWLETAKRKHWIVTGGSDFHGDMRSGSVLGSSWIGEETFKLLHKRHNENNKKDEKTEI